MKPIFLIPVLLSLALAGCGDKTIDSDGVPIVDLHGTIIVSEKAVDLGRYGSKPAVRQRIITLPNKSTLPLGNFLHQYCSGKKNNETCIKGQKIDDLDRRSDSKVADELPAGL